MFKWLNKTFQEYQQSEGLYDDEDYDTEEEDDSSNDEEKEPSEDFNASNLRNVEENEEGKHTPTVHRATRTTRSGVRFAPIDEKDEEDNSLAKQNEKVVREMKRLSGTFINPEASKLIEVQQVESLEAAVEGDQSGRDATSIAIDQIYIHIYYLNSIIRTILDTDRQ